MYGCQCVGDADTSLGVHVGLQLVDRSLEPHTSYNFCSKRELSLKGAGYCACNHKNID